MLMRRFNALISVLLSFVLVSYFYVPAAAYAATAYAASERTGSNGELAIDRAEETLDGSQTSGDQSTDQDDESVGGSSDDAMTEDSSVGGNEGNGDSANVPSSMDDELVESPSSPSLEESTPETKSPEPTDTVSNDVDPADLAAAHSADLPDGTYTISSALSSNALIDAKGAGTTAGTVVQIYASNGTDAQVWRVRHDGNYVVIASAKSGLVLDIKGGEAADKAALELNESSDSMSQRWIAQLEDDGSYTLISALDSSMVVDLAAGKTVNATPVQVYSANGTNAQRWNVSKTLTEQEALDAQAKAHSADLPDGEYAVVPQKSDDVAVGDGSTQASLNYVSYRDSIIWIVSHDEQGYVTFINKSSGEALDVNGGKTANATKVQSYVPNGTKAQKWIVEKQADGSFRIISALDSSMVLDAAAGSTKSGTAIRIYSDNGTAAQRWQCIDVTAMRSSLDDFAAENRDVLADGTYAITIGDPAQRMTVDVASGSKENAANVRLYSSNATGAQRWIVSHDDKGYVTFTSVGSGKVLDVSSGYANGSRNIQQYEGNDSLAQKWIVAKNEDGTYHILSALWQDRALEVANGSMSNAANIQIGHVGNSSAQSISFFNENPQVEPCEDILPTEGYSRLSPQSASGYVVDMPSASRDNGKNPQLYAPNGTLAQLYSFEYVDGYYLITCAASNKCLDVSEGDVVPGALIQQWSKGTSNGHELFSAVENSDGSYSFINKATGLALSVDGASSGSKLKTSIQSDSSSQRFTIEEQTTLLNEGTYTFALAANTNLVLDVSSGSGATNANIQVYTANSSFAQKWNVSLVEGEENVYTIESIASGMLLTATDNGDIKQAPAASSSSQQWRAQVKNGYYVFESIAHPGMVLGVKGSSAKNGSDIELVTASDSSLQQFKLSSVSTTVANGVYYIRIAGASNTVLDVYGGSYSSGANVQVYTKNGTGAQKWEIKRNSDGTYTILNAQSGLALDVKNGSAQAGANVQQYTPNGSNAQKWHITYENGGYKITSALSSSLVLETAGGSTSSGANVQVGGYSAAAGQQFTFLATSYIPVYHGFQNPSQYYQVSNVSVTIKNQGVNQFGYRTPSAIPVDATKQDCINAMITRAYDYLGTPYMWDYACAPGVGVDCAGLVMQCLYATGMDLSPMNPWDHYYLGLSGGWHSAYANYMWENGRFQRLSISQRQRGDIISWSGHVAIYIGNDRIIEAPAPGSSVRTNSVWAYGTPRGVLRPFVG